MKMELKLVHKRCTRSICFHSIQFACWVLHVDVHVDNICTFKASLIAQLVKNPPAMQETLVQLLGQLDPLEKGWLSTMVFLGFPSCPAGKESACNVGDLGSISGLGRSPGEGKGYPLQYSGLENSLDCIVHGVAKSWAQPTK